MPSSFLKDLLVYLPSKLLPALTAFVTVPIVTRLLTPAEFGDYALAIGVSEFLFALTCSGLGAGAVRFYPTYQVANRLGAFFATLGASLALAISGGCALSLTVLAVLGDRLPADLQSLMLISILIFAAQAVYIVLMQVVRAQQRSRLYTTFELLTGYGSLALGLLLLVAFDWGASGLLWGAFIAFAIAALLLVPQVTRRAGDRGQRRTTTADLHGLWRYAWPLAIGNMAMWGLRLSDRYLLGIYRPRAEVGLYSAAYNISGKSIDVLVAVFLLSMGPLVINTWEKAGVESTRRTLRSTTRVFLILCSPATVGLSVLAAPFVMLLTDTPYHAGYQIVAFVVFASFVYGLSQIASTGLLIAHRTRRVALNQVIAVLINLALNLALVPRFGFVAAGLTTLIGYLALLGLQAWSARRYLTWPFPYRSLRNVTIASVASSFAAAGVYALANTTNGLSVIGLLLGILLAVIVYGMCLLLVGELDASEVAALKSMLVNLRQRVTTQSESMSEKSTGGGAHATLAPGAEAQPATSKSSESPNSIIV